MRQLRMRMMKSWASSLRSRYVLWFRTVPCYTTSWAQPASFSDKASLRLNSYVHTHTYKHTFFRQCMVWTHRTSASEFPSGNQMIIFCLIHLQSNPPLSPHYFHNVPSSLIPVTGGCCATLFFVSQYQIIFYVAKSFMQICKDA